MKTPHLCLVALEIFNGTLSPRSFPFQISQNILKVPQPVIHAMSLAFEHIGMPATTPKAVRTSVYTITGVTGKHFSTDLYCYGRTDGVKGYE